MAGLLAGFFAPPVVASAVAPLGTIFINAIRMTVFPLVVSMLIASIGSIGGSRALGRTGIRAAVIAVALIVVAAVAAALIAAPVLERVPVDRGAAQMLQTAADSAGASAVAGARRAGESGVSQWFIDLVPTNVLRAATDEAMLPVIVFAVLFAFALGGVRHDRRAAVLHVVDGIAEAMQRLVAVILELAPLGVFALAVPLAARLGYGVAGAVAAYIALVVALTVAGVALLVYPVGIVGGRMAPSTFASFCAPAQAVAFSSRSSLAALPAMIEAAEREGAPPVVGGFVLPLAASVFRFGGAIAQTVGVLFLARLYGIAWTPAQLASIVVTVVATTFAVPGIPGGSILAMVPVLRAADVPIDGIGILLAVDTIPDMFRTTANVTGTMAIAAVLAGRRDRETLEEATAVLAQPRSGAVNVEAGPDLQ